MHMSQILQMVEQVHGYLARVVTAPSDQVAWSVGLQVAAITKLDKYRNGDLYRNTTKANKGYYRAVVERDGITDPVQKWTTWYNINIKALKALKMAAAGVQGVARA